MIDPRFVLLGALISLLGSSRYVVDTLRGRTRPNRVTWFLWALAPTIGFVVQVAEGIGLPAVLTLSIAVGPAAIFAASFVNPESYWRISRFDLGCGAVSVVALVVWLLLDDATTAIVLAVLADLVAGVPTMTKAWRRPETESATVYAFAAVNGTISLLALERWYVDTWAFPVYITLLGVGLAAVVALRRRRTSGASSHPDRSVGTL